MNTQRREYTAQDSQEIERASVELRENGFDDWSEEGVRINAALVDEYFQQNPTVPVT